MVAGCISESFKNMPGVCVPYAKDVISDRKNCSDHVSQESLATLKFNRFRSYVSGQGFFIGQLVIARFGMGRL